MNDHTQYCSLPLDDLTVMLWLIMLGSLLVQYWNTPGLLS